MDQTYKGKMIYPAIKEGFSQWESTLDLKHLSEANAFANIGSSINYGEIFLYVIESDENKSNLIENKDYSLEKIIDKIKNIIESNNLGFVKVIKENINWYNSFSGDTHYNLAIVNRNIAGPDSLREANLPQVKSFARNIMGKTGEYSNYFNSSLLPSFVFIPNCIGFQKDFEKKFGYDLNSILAFTICHEAFTHLIPLSLYLSFLDIIYTNEIFTWDNEFFDCQNLGGLNNHLGNNLDTLKYPKHISTPARLACKLLGLMKSDKEMMKRSFKDPRKLIEYKEKYWVNDKYYY